MKAVKENRVLTVVERPPSKKKDCGIVGFHVQPQASYLVFPKALSAPARTRVVGIRYHLVAQPQTADPLPRPAFKLSAQPRAKPRSRETTFTVILRRVAVLESSITVLARNPKEARAKALNTIRHEPFALAKAVLANEVKSVQ